MNAKSKNPFSGLEKSNQFLNWRNLLLISVALIAFCFVCMFSGLILDVVAPGPTITLVDLQESVQKTLDAINGDSDLSMAISTEASLLPTETLLPTATNTIEPTFTPEDTKTPTPVPEPIQYSGSGDSILDIDVPHTMGVLHIVEKNADRNFSVVSYGSNNDYLDLLVNTLDPYDGYRLINTETGVVRRLEIQTDGSWTITWLPLDERYVKTVSGSATVQGSGDSVVILKGGTPDTVIVTGNAGRDNFALIAYSFFGEYLDLLINTIDPYSGTVLLPADSYVLDITATGEWRIEVRMR